MYAHFTQLDDEALLHISGPDSLTFLQGQTTCDTRIVSAEQAVSGAYCTPQGRMVCDFLLAALGDDHFGLRMRGDVVPAAAEAFGKGGRSFASREALIEVLASELAPGTTVLVKGSRSMGMEKVVAALAATDGEG